MSNYWVRWIAPILIVVLLTFYGVLYLPLSYSVFYWVALSLMVSSLLQFCLLGRKRCDGLSTREKNSPQKNMSQLAREVVHDIKGPLSAIHLELSQLEAPNLGPESRQRIDQHFEKIRTVLNQLSNIAKADKATDPEVTR